MQQGVRYSGQCQQGQHCDWVLLEGSLACLDAHKACPNLHVAITVPSGRSVSSGVLTLSTWQAAWSTRSTSVWQPSTKVCPPHTPALCCCWQPNFKLYHAFTGLLKTTACLLGLMHEASCACLAQNGSHVCRAFLRVSPAERVARVEMETKTVRQVGQDLLRLQERLETEKTARWVQSMQTVHACTRLLLRSAEHQEHAVTPKAIQSFNCLGRTQLHTPVAQRTAQLLGSNFLAPNARQCMCKQCADHSTVLHAGRVT